MWKEAEYKLKEDKFIGPLIVKWGSCTIKPSKKQKYFEDLVDAICSQQLSGKAAETIFKRVKKLLIKVNPKNILSKTDLELRDCGLSWQKVSYLKDLANKVNDKVLIIDNLDKLNDEDVIKQLITIKGIGKWTAEMFLMFSLGRPDILPQNDLGINKALTNLNIKPKDTEKWKPYRTVASWYLWRSLENR